MILLILFYFTNCLSGIELLFEGKIIPEPNTAHTVQHLMGFAKTYAQSLVHCTHKTLIYYDMQAWPGMSGAAIVDVQGRVVGVHVGDETTTPLDTIASL